MNIPKQFALAVCVLALQASATVLASGDPAKGADTFAQECGDCHSTVAGKNKKGPSLVGLDRRPAGSLASFEGYSAAMKASGMVWEAEKLDPYIEHPRKVVPGGKMKYEGLPDAAARADVIAYILSLK